jgi:hypothetical protein
MKSYVLGFALLSFIAMFASAPAQAVGTLTRTFVSSTGVDSNPCTITQPCATFAAAYNAVAANGIVAALDPGKYGPLYITTGVTINGNGWAAITAQATGTGITISAISGNVTLIGLEIDGAGAAYNGIIVNYAASLTVINCTLQNFVTSSNSNVLSTVINTGNGILMQPSEGTFNFTITNTTTANNGQAGIIYLPISGPITANGIIDRVVATANQAGIIADVQSGDGGTTGIAVSNSIVSNNFSAGMYIEGQPLEVTISDSHIDNTANYGVYVLGGNVVLTDVTINLSGTGVFLDGAGYGGVAAYFSHTTIAGFPGLGVDIGNAVGTTAVSDGTNHLGQVSGTIGTWTAQ